MKWLYLALAFAAVVFGCAISAGMGLVAFSLTGRNQVADSYTQATPVIQVTQVIVAPVTVKPSATALPFQGQAGSKSAAPTPPPPVKKSPTETDPIVKMEIVSGKMKWTGEITHAYGYCFAIDGSKPAQSGPCPPNETDGDYRWDVPGAQGKNVVGWQTGYPGETPIVINGHRDSVGDLFGHAFRDLQLLKVGDKLTLTTRSGKQFSYVMYDWELLALSDPRVAWTINAVQTENLPLNVVVTYTCGGDLKADPKTGRIQYTSRRLIYWKPVETIPPK